MGKVVAVVLWAWIPFVWQPLWGQAPSVGVQPAHNQKQQTGPTASQTQPDSRGTKDSPLIVETHSHPSSKEEAAEEKRKDDEKESIDRRTFYLAVANTFFTGLLTLVGIGGVVLGVCTLRFIRIQGDSMRRQTELIERQAVIMRSQTALMQIQYRQWVEIANWRVEGIPRADPIEKVRIRAILINPTGFPMTILNGQITFGDPFGNAEDWKCWEIPDGFFLPPKTPYVIDMTIDLLEHDASRFTNGNLDIHLRGGFSHVGSLGKPTSQPLWGTLTCGRWGATYIPTVHMNPKTEENQPQDDSGHPNP